MNHLDKSETFVQGWTHIYWALFIWDCISTLQWRHNDHDGVSNHQPYDFYSLVYSDADQKKHQSFASLAFVRGIHRGPVNSPHKGPVTRKMFPFDDVIMSFLRIRDIYWPISLMVASSTLARFQRLNRLYVKPPSTTAQHIAVTS